MTRQEAEALRDELADLHWRLVGLYARLDRGLHRFTVATADHAVCSVLHDLTPDAPKLTVIAQLNRQAFADMEPIDLEEPDNAESD